MQLKLKRSQRQGGMLSKSVIFCIDARVEFTPDEQHHITRYKLHGEVIYNSEASRRHLDQSAAHQDGSFGGGLRSLASVAMAALKLNITIGSLQKGQHVECKSLDELLAAEDAILTACKNLKAFLETAATFDGREVLIDFDTAEPVIIAEATRPERKLIAQAPAPFAAYSAPASARLSHADATPSYAYAEPAGSYGPPSSDSEMEALGRFFAENNLFPKIAVGIVLFVIFYAIVQSYL